MLAPSAQNAGQIPACEDCGAVPVCKEAWRISCPPAGQVKVGRVSRRADVQDPEEDFWGVIWRVEEPLKETLVGEAL